MILLNLRKALKMGKVYSIGKEEAKEILQPYAQLFFDAIMNGFEDYKKHDQKRGHIHDNCVKSNLVRSYVLNRVRQVIASHPELKLRQMNRMFIIIIADKIMLRFKKLNDQYKSDNIPTRQATKFRKRELTFPGVHALPVDAGWQVNEFYNEIESVHFVCPDGEGNLWRIPLEDISVRKMQTAAFNIPEEEIIQIVKVKPGIADDNRKTAG